MRVYHDRVARTWRGDGAAAFVNRSATLPRSYAHVAGVYRTAAGALDSYAGVLEEAQRTFDQAQAMVAADNRRQQASMARDPAAVADLLSVDRVRARRMLQVALDRLQVSNRHTSAVLRGLESQDGHRPTVLPEIYRSQADSRRQGLDEIRHKGVADLDGLWAALQIFRPSKTVGVAQGTLLSTADELEGLVSNPVTYVGSDLYDALDIKELQAGNDARFAGGLAYALIMPVPRKVLTLVPHRHRQCDDASR